MRHPGASNVLEPRSAAAIEDVINLPPPDEAWHPRDSYRDELNALPAHIAFLDRSGRITLVNQAWATFADENSGLRKPDVGVGTHYLEVCRRAAATDAVAQQALLGITAVLDGVLPEFAMEYPCHHGTTRLWFLMTVASLPSESGGGAVISHQNITRWKLAELNHRDNEQRFRAMFDNAAAGIAQMRLDGHFLRVNPAMCRLTGYLADAMRAMTWSGITHSNDIDVPGAHLEVMRSGGIDAFTVEQRLVTRFGGETWVSTTISCVRTVAGTIDYLVAVVQDISERKRAEERQRTLMMELAHRGKNLLAVIQSVASRSLTGDRPLKEAREAFNGRLHALAHTYGTLTNEAFDGAVLETIVQSELAAFGGRVHLDGPGIMLTVKAAQTFTLVVHELATNAAKYGALSVADGQLFLRWEIGGSPREPRFLFDWREEGGPPAEPPRRRGFGTTLISQIAAAEFRCNPDIVYDAKGFHYRIDAPLAELGMAMVESPLRRKLKSQIVQSLYDTWAQRRGVNDSLPPLSGFDWTRFAITGALTIATVEKPETIRFVQVGRALIECLGRPLEAGDLAEDEESGLMEVYRRCARNGEPTHELLRFDFGDGDPLTFERLLVPFSATGDGAVTHLVGISVFDGPTR